MLEPGTIAPAFELPDQNGEMVSLSDLLGRSHVVLFFYPKDNTMVCTLEVCAFRDAHDELLEEDAVVLGISSDPVDSHLHFAERWRLPYRLLADKDSMVRKAYDIPKTFGLFPGRVTYVIDKQGIIRTALNDPLRASHHVRSALRTLKAQRTS